VHLLSEKVDRAVVNAGEGGQEHPTQAPLDALTIRRRKGRLGGLTVAICRDLLHSRVVRLERVAVRMACLEILTHDLGNRPPLPRSGSCSVVPGCSTTSSIWPTAMSSSTGRPRRRSIPH
jgi:hypothetical protein